jgi:hypothetical protein
MLRVFPRIMSTSYMQRQIQNNFFVERITPRSMARPTPPVRILHTILLRGPPRRHKHTRGDPWGFVTA